MRIFLAEDNDKLSNKIESLFRKEGISVSTTNLGDNCIKLIKMYDFDALILKSILPDMNALQILRDIRESNIGVPCIVISDIPSKKEEISVLYIGGDDYVSSSIDLEILKARVFSLVRRNKVRRSRFIKTGNLIFNLETRSASIKNEAEGSSKVLKLTDKERKILEILNIRKGFIINNEMFLKYIYGGDCNPNSKTITVFICKLRKKISEENNGENYIRTIRGKGIVLQDPQ